MRAIDIIHKQLSHSVVLTIEVIKLMLSETLDSVNQRQNKRLYILEQFTNVL